MTISASEVNSIIKNLVDFHNKKHTNTSTKHLCFWEIYPTATPASLTHVPSSDIFLSIGEITDIIREAAPYCVGYNKYSLGICYDQKFLDQCDVAVQVDKINGLVTVRKSDILTNGTFDHSAFITILQNFTNLQTLPVGIGKSGFTSSTINDTDSEYRHSFSQMNELPPNEKPKRKCDCGAWILGITDEQDAHDTKCSALIGRRPN